MDEMSNLTLDMDQFNYTDFMERPAVWGFFLNQIFTPIFTVIGIVGNCLSFIVMKSKTLRNKSYSHYLCALAVFDSLVLIGREVMVTNELLMYYGKPGVFVNFSATACKIFNFAECVCYLMSSWIIVCMAQERLLVVYMPFKKHAFTTQRGAILIILSLFIVMSYTQVFRLVMVTNNNSQCESIPELYTIYTALHVYFYQFCLIFTLPVIIVFVCNIMVLCKIHHVRKAMQDENSFSTRLTRKSNTRHKTTIMLLAISFTYIFTLLPLVFLSFVLIIAYKVYGAAAASLVIRATPWKDLLVVVSQINYGINFFIYVLSGKKFRVELRRVFNKERASTFNSSKTRDEFMLL
ncbi:FMRFamide peptide receptor frpr-18 [Patella vulgata]|uniref:FMRFamide peptide receptor frpr-18 n=1 Tax=Patella vulgata TaxID=6465 RepID=UPI00217F901E|nr:FMRFamide peptide receptor frpr-18 [Patella vulgata]